MRLRDTAEHSFSTEFEVLDQEGVWQEGFLGKFAPIDRFLSNFHRPLQRRMLYSDPKETFPSSRVIRNAVTQEVYILGQSREDEEHGEAYAKLTVAHLVSNYSSGLATINRKVVDEARPDGTIGELIDSVVGAYYITIEYKSSIEAFGADEVFEDRFILFASIDVQLEAEDVLVLGNDTYIVNTPYVDSDYSSAICTREADDRVTGIYKSTSYSYSPTTGDVTPTYINYSVTCTVTSKEVDTDKQGISADADIYLKSPSFPLTPIVGDRFSVEGNLYVIRAVLREQEANYQWLLKCDKAAI